MGNYIAWRIEPIFVDVRVIAATHQNLEEMVVEDFREDLFHRLNVIRLELLLSEKELRTLKSYLILPRKSG